MLPVKKPTTDYRTLDEIRQRKEKLADEIQLDNTKFTTLWNQVFLKKEVKHKKRVTAVTQTFVNLKSNTMKNTVQRYGLISIFQGFFPKKFLNLNHFNVSVPF